MITYRFISQSLAGQNVKVQYSKYSSSIRIDLGSGTFPFEYTTDQKGGTYYFYVPSLDTTYPKTIDIPPIDFYINTLNVPDCDISGFTNNIPSCDIENQIITIPVCDVDYEIEIVTPTPTPTVSTICPSISAVTVGPIEISGGEYTSCLNPTNLLLHQFNSSGLYICDIPSQSDSILPDSLFVDEITVLVPSPYWFGGPCQYCFNINTGELFECSQVIPSPTPTPSITNTMTPTPSITSTITSTVTPTPTITPTIELSQTPTQTITPTPSITQTLQPETPTITPTNTLTPTPTITPTNTLTPTPIVCNCISLSASTPGDGVFLITLQGDEKAPRKDYSGFTPITNQQLKLQFFSSSWQMSVDGNYFNNSLLTTSVCPIGETWTSSVQLTIYSTIAIVCPPSPTNSPTPTPTQI